MRTLLFFGLLHLMACGENEEEEKVNSDPFITSLSIGPSGPVFTTSEVRCIATAADDDNDALTMSYQWEDEQGNSLGDGAEIALNYEIVQPGESLYCIVTVSDGETEIRGQTNVVIENTDPVVTEVRITPDEVTLSSLLDCSFSVSEADGEQVTTSYSWTHNGSEVSTTSTLQLDSDAFSTGDTLTCTVTLEDESGGTGTGSGDTEIGNTAPAIGSVRITPEEAYSFNVLTCTANDITDADNNEVTLSYEWFINSELHTESSNMLSGPFSVGANVVCRVTPNDGYTNGIMSQDIVTIINSAPVINNMEITPSTGVEADSLLTCSVVGADADNEELAIVYSWTDFSGNALSSTDVLQLDTNIASPGDVFTCTATVTDPNEESATQTQTVSVGNTAPVVDSNATITGDATTTSTLNCSAGFIDANDGALATTYAWTNAQGITVGTNSSYTILASETNVGELITCTASATDNDGATITSSASTTVVNTTPVLSGVSLSPDPAGTEDTLTCSVTSTSDIDEDTVNIKYQWVVDGVSNAETSNMLSGPFVVDSVIVCSATANDGTEDGNTETTSITISNSIPVVDSVELNSGSVYTNDTLTATTLISDSDSGQTISATYAWYVVDTSSSGALSEVQTGPTNTLDGSYFDKEDEVYVIVTPNDGVTDGAAFTSNTVTISNSVPTGLAANIASSDSFYNDSILTCSASASDIDPEDSTLTYDYTWSNGILGPDLILDGSLSPGEDITCTATATDSSGASVSVDATETLLNRTPVVDSVSLPQGVTAESESILCAATGSDADGETPTFVYTWTINGTQSPEISDTLTDSFSYNDVIECMVTAVDGTENGSSMTESIMVENTLPVVDSVSLDSDPVYTDSTLTATAVLSDADSNQTVSPMYSWFVKDTSNGGVLSNVQNGVNHTLDGSHFDKDDEVYVVVKPNDGVENGPTLTSSSITVLNTAPTSASISITPDPATVGSDNLTCTVDVASTDIDGDAIVYTYVWTDPNGDVQQTTTESSSTTDVYLASGTTEGTWNCEVTPYDMTDYGTLVSTDISVELTPVPVCSISISHPTTTNVSDQCNYTIPEAGLLRVQLINADVSDGNRADFTILSGSVNLYVALAAGYMNDGILTPESNTQPREVDTAYVNVDSSYGNVQINLGLLPCSSYLSSGHSCTGTDELRVEFIPHVQLDETNLSHIGTASHTNPNDFSSLLQVGSASFSGSELLFIESDTCGNGGGSTNIFLDDSSYGFAIASNGWPESCSGPTMYAREIENGSYSFLTGMADSDCCNNTGTRTVSLYKGFRPY